jgi:hypothetical protein
VSSSSNAFNVIATGVQSFEISMNTSTTQVAGVPFPVTIRAKDGLNGTGNTVTSFNGTVTLRINTGTTIFTNTSVDSISGTFSNGERTELVRLEDLAGITTGKVLMVVNTSNKSISGVSGAFTARAGVPVSDPTLTAVPSTLSADGASTSTITSTQILDEFGNPVSNRRFTITLDDNDKGSIQSPADLAPGTPGHQILTTGDELSFVFLAGLEGGTLRITAVSDSGSSNSSVNITLGSLAIQSVTTNPSTVSRGQDNITVNMVIQNTGGTSVTNIGGQNARLNFLGPGSVILNEYATTVTRTDAFTEIPGGASRTLSYSVDIPNDATLGLVTIDGEVHGLLNGVDNVDVTAANNPDQWTVQDSALVRIDQVVANLDTVVQGQSADTIQVTIANPAPAGGAAAVIDDVDLIFRLNGQDRSSNFTQQPVGSNPQSIPAAGSVILRYTVGVDGAADVGQYTIDASITAHDQNSAKTISDNGSASTGSWLVIGKPVLQITGITTSPLTAYPAGDTTDWQVRVAVSNNGTNGVVIDSADNRTFIRFVDSGVNRTGDFTIRQPASLFVNGGFTLDGGASDFLVFLITETGSVPSTYEIRASVEGNDDITGSPVEDNTDDGGTGQVQITDPGRRVFIANTLVPVSTPNRQGETGIVDTGQQFQVSVTVRNDLTERVQGITVNLSSTGNSQIVQPTQQIAINAGQTGTLLFNVTGGSPNPSEIFTADITNAGTGQSTGTPASEGPPSDNQAVFVVQTPVNLSVNFEAFGTSISIGETINITAKVTSPGAAEFESAGQLTLTVPSGFTLNSPAVRPFQKDAIVTWSVTAPNNESSGDQLRVDITTIPTATNTGLPATVLKAQDTRTVETLATNLSVTSFRIVSPQGATDDTLSTGQEFNVQAVLDVSATIDEIQFELGLPSEYVRISGSPILETMQNQGQQMLFNWRLSAPQNADNSARPMILAVSEAGGDAADSDTIQVVSVTRAFVGWSGEGLSVSQPAGFDGQLTVNQPFQISARVTQTGAGVVGNVRMELNLNNSGITLSPGDSLIREFVPVPGGQVVTWDLTAPSVADAGQNEIFVRIESFPNDENTGLTVSTAGPSEAEKSIPISAVVASGGISINSFRVIDPLGAQDGILSTEQDFRVEVGLSWDGLETDVPGLLPSVELITPATVTFTVQGNRFGQLNEPSNPGATFSWVVRTPTTPAPELSYIKVRAQGWDRNDNDIVITDSDSLGFTVVERAKVDLTAAISDPLPARDGVVTAGGIFYVTATMRQTGAAVNGLDDLTLTLPSSNYQLVSPASQTLPVFVDGRASVTWEIRAPQVSTATEVFTVRLSGRNAVDQNSMQAPLYTPIQADQSVSVQVPIRTEKENLKVDFVEGIPATTTVKGSQNFSLLGLVFFNDNDGPIQIDSIRVNLRGSGAADIAPNSIANALRVVNHDNTSTVYATITLGTSGPIVVAFTTPVSIPSGDSLRLAFQANLLEQDVVQQFTLSIDAPQADIIARSPDSDERIDIRDRDGLAFGSRKLAPGGTVLYDAGLQASFYNYPNPFTPNSGVPERERTIIQYHLEQDSDVTIRIYTLFGELVRTWSWASNQPPGRQGKHEELTWDGRNGNGSVVLSGVYIAVVTTNHGTAKTKIAVAR